uniref:Mediator of RNA polymerase II transcription subunit 29 n=1 Tax=Timema cristinae TaxID=61476 RepID=A0A7R9DC42_TIMCR|nr:unnamed protein product [Timema cristinae]
MNMQPQVSGPNLPGPNLSGPLPPGVQQPGTPQQAQQMQQQMAQPQEKLDNISKGTLKTTAQAIHQNGLVDVGSLKGLDVAVPRHDKHMEEFYSICDQIELHLKTSIECLNQGTSSQRYLPLPVAPTRTEPLPNQDGGTLTYPQFLATVRSQVSYAKEVHDTLMTAAQNIAPTE